MEEKKNEVIPQLAPMGLNGFDYVSTRFDALIPIGVTLEQILKPAFWAHHAVKLKPMDEIRARAEDGTWLAYLVVLDCSRTWAKVAHLAMHNLTTRDVSLTQASLQELADFIAGHKVVHRAAQVVGRAQGGQRGRLRGHEQKDAAEKALEKHARESIGVKATAKLPEPSPA
jgi:hypothetical protein